MPPLWDFLNFPWNVLPSKFLFFFYRSSILMGAEAE